MKGRGGTGAGSRGWLVTGGSMARERGENDGPMVAGGKDGGGSNGGKAAGGTDAMVESVCLGGGKASGTFPRICESDIS